MDEGWGRGELSCLKSWGSYWRVWLGWAMVGGPSRSRRASCVSPSLRRCAMLATSCLPRCRCCRCVSSGVGGRGLLRGALVSLVSSSSRRSHWAACQRRMRCRSAWVCVALPCPLLPARCWAVFRRSIWGRERRSFHASSASLCRCVAVLVRMCSQSLAMISVHAARHWGGMCLAVEVAVSMSCHSVVLMVW